MRRAMRAFLMKRLLWMIPSFLGITLVVFVIVRAAPGDPLSLQGDLALGAEPVPPLLAARAGGRHAADLGREPQAVAADSRPARRGAAGCGRPREAPDPAARLPHLRDVREPLALRALRDARGGAPGLHP